MPPKRKYDSGYIKFGFTSIEINKEIRPQCVICATVLSNEALKPAKLERHLKTHHSNLSDRPPEFFAGKLENLKKMKLGKTGAAYESSEKVLAASFEIFQLIAKAKKPHTIGETLVKPCLIKAVEQVLGLDASKKMQDIPLSNNTVKSRIDSMSTDIENQLVCEIKNSPYFSLQCDESTDVSQCSQLLVFVRYLGEENKIKEELLMSQELETTSKGEDVMKIICDYFKKHGLDWKKLVGFCTDGAPAMLGSRTGLATLLKEKNPNIVTMHCIIHRQALASKTMPEDLLNAMKSAIKMMNSVKGSAKNTEIFKKLFTELDSEHETLLYHTEVRWLSKGNMLARLYELREELKAFFIETKMQHFLEQLCEPSFEIKLAHLVDIFNHLNQLNLQLQGSGNEHLDGTGNIVVFEDKLRAFLCKIDLWIGKVEENIFQSFPSLNVLANNKEYASVTDQLKHNILNHLSTLKREFGRYFPEYGKNEIEHLKKLIRNPFNVRPIDLPDGIQEEAIELQNDSNFKDSYDLKLEELWCKKALTFPKIRQVALRYLIMFSTTFLCEQGFSTLLLMKNKQSNRLSVSSDLRVALSKSLSPRIPQLVKHMRAQKSH